MSGDPPTAVVTGAGRGLGLEFARQLAQRGVRVLGTVRKPSPALEETGAVGLQLDVSDAEAIAAFPEQVREHCERVDLLVNNAGINSRGVAPEQGNVRFGELEPEGILRMVRINAIAPVLVAQALSDLLKEGSKIVSISSWLGSIAGKSSGGNYGYCASKTTLNMLARAMAFDLAPRGITSVVVNPGWVSTDMGGAKAKLTPEQSVQGLLRVVDTLTLDDAGKFLQWDGSPHPW
ncbi:MAG: SDR family oxidoreductase [Nannocystaceae bacterium]|nr:SDR family oxidoreductase [bacterium]